MGTSLFNGKEFSKLCLDDLKDVYFPTVLEAERFYCLYSRSVGFNIRRSRSEIDENGKVIRRRWVCSKEGKSPGQTEKEGSGCDLQAKAGEKRSRRGLVSRGVRYSLDEEGRLANLFWKDHQSLLDYKAYSDVLIMDTTYKTNLYRKPLVIFFGCNTHRATVVFGFALIRNEREVTYEHGLVDNVWVTDLFNRRERWAETFFRGHFYGGMCSTQRVEGMHSKLKPDLDMYTLIFEMMPKMERSVSRIRDRVLYNNFR
ncbi:hypothetical protein ACLB2K_019455 [Fragaria x ananassa]